MNNYKRDRKFERRVFFIVLLITFALFFLLEKWGETKYGVVYAPDEFGNLKNQIDYIGYYKDFSVYEYTDKETDIKYIIFRSTNGSVSITPKLDKVN